MPLSVFDLFKVGIGPSSSHTVGPMRAARQFALGLKSGGLLKSVTRIKAEMYGSLGATGKGHGTPKAVLMGLEGEEPETVEIESIAQRVATIKEQSQLTLLGEHSIHFTNNKDLCLYRDQALPFHSNGMRYTAFNAQGDLLAKREFYSVGGGFVIDETGPSEQGAVKSGHSLPYAFTTGAELLSLCKEHKLSISELMQKNEQTWRDTTATNSGLLELWDVMQACIETGIHSEGELPGGLNVGRRAKKLYTQLLSKPEATLSDALSVLDWVTLYALAVNEENAAGGRIVTAPTNGAAGIIPAVLNYYMRFYPTAVEGDVIRFLLTAAAIGILYKENASISGAEVGCQGEVGSACSMAAAGLTELLGGSPEQVENAAEIAMEHNLGLTCDPIGGLVQVPCIERNAMAAVKAIHAARVAMRGDGSHFVSLDKVIKTMRETGRDMNDKYKETARGGLALNVIEVPVNIVEC